MNKLETLSDLLPQMALHKDRPAIIALQKESKEEWSYAKLADQANRLAAGFNKAQIAKGDHLAIFAENGPPWIAVCLGILAAGAVVVPLDVQLADDVLRHALEDSGARYVFTSGPLLKRVQSIASDFDCELILLDEAAEGVRGWQDLCADPSESVAEVSPEDQATLFYTSGTTGLPKGVPLTHENLAFQLNALVAAELVTSDDRILLPLPLHHVYPFTIGVLTPLVLGLPIVLPYTLTGPQLMRALHEGEVTVIIGVPRLYQALVSGIQSRAAAAGFLPRILFRAALVISTAMRRLHIRVGRFIFRRLHREMGPDLRVMASGGAALDPDLALQLEALGWQIGTGYGLTETSPLLTLDSPGRARLGSVGRSIDGIEIRIDRNDKMTKTDSKSKDGEVVVRGPSVFAGYHNLPDKTKEAFTDDGWFRTGDLGYIDEDGYLFITGRMKTLIVLKGGEKVQPDEVEEAYAENVPIREAGILEQDGKLVAVIRPKREAGVQGEGSQDDGSAIRKALEEKSKSLPSYQHILDFVITDAPLPRTRLGKIRREELQELYKKLKEGKAEAAKAGPISEDEMSPDDRVLLDDPVARKMWEWLANRFSQHPLTPDTSPKLDLGIDSLEWLNLTLEIRQACGVELSEEAISRIETVRDLLREVSEQPEGKEPGAATQPLENPDEVLGDERNRWLAPLTPGELLAARCLYALDWLLVHSAFRLKVEGREKLPKQGPFLLAPNHVSYLDSFVLAAALDFKLLTNTYWAAWSGVAFGPFFRFLRRLSHVVPIDADHAAASSLAFGAVVLRDKHNMVWFPEGGYSRSGELGPLKQGTGMLLEHYPVAVVPVHLEGTRKALPPGRWLPRPANIRIKFGEPLDPHELEKKGKGDQPHERITNALSDEMAKLAHN